jgi:hypothetical protein
MRGPRRTSGEGPGFPGVGFCGCVFLGVCVAPDCIALHGTWPARRSRIGQTKPTRRYQAKILYLVADERLVGALCVLGLRGIPRMPDRVKGVASEETRLHSPLRLDVRRPSCPPPRLLYHDCVGGLGVGIGSSTLFSTRSGQAPPCDDEAGVEGTRARDRSGRVAELTRESLFICVQGFMEEHLEICLIAKPALGGERACPHQFLRRDPDGDCFRGAGQVGLAQTTHLSLLLSGLESFGENFGVCIPPGSFLFFSGKFGNGLVSHGN